MAKIVEKIKTYLANRKNYGSKRSTSQIKYIVIHYTANDGDTDENNGKYFRNNVVYSSAHYFVDDDSITQSVPDNYVAYSVGGAKWSDCAKTGGGKYYGKCTNANSLSIEICDDVKNGKVYPSAKTIELALDLTKEKMKQYKIPASNVIRHFDVNGKYCPAYWSRTAENNAKWKTEFHNKLTAPATKYYRVQTGAFSIKKNADNLLKKVKKKGFSAYVTKVNGYYKVQVGAFSNMTNATNMLNKLRAAGFAGFITYS